MPDLLEGFRFRTIDVDGVEVRAGVAGSGPPLLLLHGYPQTQVMWHAVAPLLTDRFTVVTADLRGYGDSSKPDGGPDHAGYAKRAMARDQVGLMARLGFERFAVAGHDRGARVVHRMCLDYPERVAAAAVLDIVPTRYVFATVDRALADAYHHWFFLSQQADLPERLIGAEPEFYLRSALKRWAGSEAAFEEDAVAEYVRWFRDPAAVHASCEDYRAAATIDLEHDEASARAGEAVRCPLLALWGAQGFVGGHYDVLRVWRRHGDDVRGESLPCGHFLPEERPAETAAALRGFFAEVRLDTLI